MFTFKFLLVIQGGDGRWSYTLKERQMMEGNGRDRGGEDGSDRSNRRLGQEREGGRYLSLLFALIPNSDDSLFCNYMY